MLSAETMARLCGAAEMEGVTPDRMVEMLLERLARYRKQRREHMRRKRAKAKRPTLTLVRSA